MRGTSPLAVTPSRRRISWWGATRLTVGRHDQGPRDDRQGRVSRTYAPSARANGASPRATAVCRAGSKALHLAAEANKLPAVAQLVGRWPRGHEESPLPGGLPVNAAGQSAPHETARRGHDAVAAAMVDARPAAAALRALDRSARNAYHTAAAKGHATAATVLGVAMTCSRHVDDPAFAGTTDGRRRGALHAAAAGGHATPSSRRCCPSRRCMRSLDTTWTGRRRCT